MIKGKMIDNVFYTWEQIYKISGLVYEDWLYGEGMDEEFKNCLTTSQHNVIIATHTPRLKEI